MNKDTKRVICTVTAVVTVITIAAAAALWIRSKKEEKKFGGKLINVNYKFSKEFEN